MELFFDPRDLSEDVAGTVYRLFVDNTEGITTSHLTQSRCEIEGMLPEAVIIKWLVAIQFTEKIAIEPNAERKQELLLQVANTRSVEEAADAVAEYFGFDKREKSAFLASFKRVSYCLVNNQDVTLEGISGDDQTILRGCLARVFGTAFLEESLTEIAVTLRQSVKEAQLAEEAEGK